MLETALIIAGVVVVVAVVVWIGWNANPYNHISKEQRDWIKRNTDGWPG